MTLAGIDISHHNFTVIQAEERRTKDGWLYNKASDGFVIMKATEGVTFDDPRMMDYVRLIGESNIRFDFASVGFYHYARPENNTPEAEAKHFYERVKQYIGNAVLALDVEGRALEMPSLDTWCYKWLKAVETLTGGVKPMIYIQRSALNLFDEVPANDYGLWLASWQKQKPKKPAPWEFMAIWQNNGQNIDTDYFFGNKKAWLKYARGGK